MLISETRENCFKMLVCARVHFFSSKLGFNYFKFYHNLEVRLRGRSVHLCKYLFWDTTSVAEAMQVIFSHPLQGLICFHVSNLSLYLKYQMITSFILQLTTALSTLWECKTSFTFLQTAINLTQTSQRYFCTSRAAHCALIYRVSKKKSEK